MKRIHIKVGEKETCNVRIPIKAFCVYDDEGVSKVDSSKFTLYVGVSQPDDVSIALGCSLPIEISINI